jgi:TolA-binding protein
VLVYIEGLAANVTTSAEALQRLEALQRVDTTTLEEFATAGANRVAEQSERLQELHAQLLQQKADAAELEALRQEKARREAEEAAEALRLEGERRAAARLAAQQEEARRRAEAPAPAPAPAPTAPRPAGQQWSTPTPLARPPQGVARDIRAEQLATLVACLKGKTASVVAAELLDGTFHPAISINTSLL